MNLLSEMLNSGAGFTTYGGLVLLLYLTSFGLPIPEEITLVWAGALAYEHAMGLPPAILVAMGAILAADVQVYYIGRHFGPRVLRHRFFSKYLVPPERLAKAQKRFAGHSTWAIFTVRFFSGLRWPTYFSAGMLGVRAYKFVLVDLAAATVHVSAYVLLGYVFGPHVEDIVAFIKKADRWIGVSVILALVMLAVLIGYRLGKRRQRKEDKAVGGIASSAAAEPTDLTQP